MVVLAGQPTEGEFEKRYKSLRETYYRLKAYCDELEKENSNLKLKNQQLEERFSLCGHC